MYNLSSKFNTFYKNFTVLSKTEQDDLSGKKDINIKRLKDGLEEYNIENNTTYHIAEIAVQGSMAMSTIIQNENNDYDIDVAVVFDSFALGDKGPLATRNIVADALRRTTKQFKAEPEVKTSCVRLRYAEGYHVDFAVYRRCWDSWNNCYRYEHAGSEWALRDLRGLTEWFKHENDNSNDNLRKVVRLSKMFCRSRESWVNMPSGLIQTVLCSEQLESSYDRIDELFYYTMSSIVTRLENSLSVSAPVDNGRVLTPRQSDIAKMTNWKNRLKSKLADLAVLFSEDCKEVDALQAWYGFFNHSYWKNEIPASVSSNLQTSAQRHISSFRDTEQFIEDRYPVRLNYHCSVSCSISGNGWKEKPLRDFLRVLGKYIPHNFRVKCAM